MGSPASRVAPIPDEELDALSGDSAAPERRTDALVSRDAFFDTFHPSAPGQPTALSLLKGSWLRARAKELRAAKERGDAEAVRTLVIARRQEMPADAFMTADECRELSDGIPKHLGRLAACSASYCWATKEHPDPEGDSLLALADGLEDMYRKKREGVVQYKDFPEDVGLFWDYPCLFQHPHGGKRTDEEDRLFGEALNNLEMIYAHALTTVFLLSKSAPPTRPSYEASGWTSYEATVARILKSRKTYVWPPVIDLHQEGEESSEAVKPPLSIAAFDEKVQTLSFTNGADRGVVRGIYERTIRAALGGAEALAYMNSAAWTDADAASFAGSLPLCSRLKKLQIELCNLGDRGVVALAAGLSKVPTLEKLDLHGTGCGDDGLVALAAALPQLPRLKELNLNNNDRIGTAGLRALGQAKLPSLCKLLLSYGSFRDPPALLDALQADSLPLLEELWINNNDQMSVQPLVRALERKAVPKLNHISAKGTLAEVDVEALREGRQGLRVD